MSKTTDVKNSVVDIPLAERLSLIQASLKVKKGNYNSFGKYHYRSAEDILEALKPFMVKYGVTFLSTEKLKNTLNGVPILVTTAKIVCIATMQEISASAIVGVDLQQKGMQVPQTFGSASSYGKKYAYGNLLLIDDTADSDASNTHGRTTAKAPAKQATKKIDLVNPSENWNKVVNYLDNGGDIEQVKGKYNIKPEDEKILTKNK